MTGLYLKNLPVWERILRVFMTISLVIAGFVLFGNGLWSWIIAVAAIGFGLTGIIGFCPMCALFGRRLPQSANE